LANPVPVCSDSRYIPEKVAFPLERSVTVDGINATADARHREEEGKHSGEDLVADLFARSTQGRECVEEEIEHEELQRRSPSCWEA
jgi:uncharacterized protein YbbK (DUF523 family)